jgi:guanosine-3',5'-bis(diphosphate) 3'-pyrophosphohydrolase
MNRIKLAKETSHEALDSVNCIRKYTKEPYWHHTDKVAAMTFLYGGDDDMVIAAFHHDTEEEVFPLNSFYSVEWLQKNFGTRATNLVIELTDIFTKEKYPNWNRAKRHEMEAKRLASISQDAKLIKICDLIDNSESIVKYDKSFAKIYLKEKFALLPIFVDCPSPLLQLATAQTLSGFDKLGIKINTITV